jgi:hypothetical protein
MLDGHLSSQNHGVNQKDKRTKGMNSAEKQKKDER